MADAIFLPDNIEISQIDERTTQFSISPYHPGYGPTVGNALRRVLLSSLPGAAITYMKVENADHEFSTLPGVKEDLVSLMLNLKRVRVSCESGEPVEIRLTASGEGKVVAADFKTPAGVSIANGDQVIATLTDKKAKLDLLCTVEQGRGYVPSEQQSTKGKDIGTVALDAIFTPVERVSFTVEHVRVGQATDYHKLVLTITTDGTIAPKEALQQASSILADHFKELTGDFEKKLTGDRPVKVEEAPEVIPAMELPENTLNLLQLPSRVHNALERVGITTVEQVLELTQEQIQDIPGLGAKAIDDISKSAQEFRDKKEAAAKE
ncbi:MAG: DNA-directed RNA polymerase subunit alpha [Candidatus Andersenbacteria bacterium]|nr:DNA-directed RNA polymerase subunit alpha [Candidatus Andersenbacteria bacterium]